MLHTALDSSSGDEVRKQMAELLLDKKYRKVRCVIITWDSGLYPDPSLYTSPLADPKIKV